MRRFLRDVGAIAARRRAVVVGIALTASFAGMSMATTALAHSAKTGAATNVQPAKKTKQEKKEAREKRRRAREERRCERQKLCKKLKEEVARQRAEIETKTTEIHTKEAEVAKLRAENKVAEEKGETKVRVELEKAEEELKTKQAELKAAEAELKKHEEELPQVEKEKLEREAQEKAQAELEKHEEEAGTWAKFKNCALNHPNEDNEREEEVWQLAACTWGQSREGSEFTAGKVTVKFTHPVIIQGGILLNEETGEERVVPPEDGAEALVPVAQPAPDLPNDVDTALLSGAELARYNEVRYAHDEISTTATIELAPAPSARYFELSTENLLDEEGTAIGLPVKVKLSNPFFGNNCYVGSNEHPIMIHLTTGTSGSLTGSRGSIYTEEEGGVIDLEGASLVENEFGSPGAQGCGGDPTVDEAIDAALGLPSETPGSNKTVITGLLGVASASEVREALERYHIPVS